MTREQERNPRKALGRGLAALLPAKTAAVARLETPPSVDDTPATAVSPPRSPQLPGPHEEFLSIPLDQIESSSEQPRSTFDQKSLTELSNSIRLNGLLQPITVFRTGPDSFRLIAGERRWRAARQAGLAAIPALVRTAEQQERLELALVENIQREDLNALEIAHAFQSLASQHHLSHEEIAERTGKDRSTVTNFLRLLRLSPRVQSALIAGEISMGHARALLSLADPGEQETACRNITERQLSVRQAEAFIKQLCGSEKSRNGSGKHEAVKQSASRGEETPTMDPNIRAALDEMSAILGTRVTLHAKPNGSGRLEIEYYCQDDLDRIYGVIVKEDGAGGRS